MTENLSSLGINFGKVEEIPYAERNNYTERHNYPKYIYIHVDLFGTICEYEDKHIKLSDFFKELPVKALVSINRDQMEMNPFILDMHTKHINKSIRTSRQPGAPIKKGSYVFSTENSEGDRRVLPFTIDTYIGGGRRKRTHKTKRHHRKTKRHHHR